MVTRQECEAKLLDLTEQAYAVMNEYDENVNRLSLFASNEGCHVTGYVWYGGKYTDIVDGFRFPELKHIGEAVNG